MRFNSYLKAWLATLRSGLYGVEVARGPLDAGPNGYSSVGGVELIGVSQRTFLDARRGRRKFRIHARDGDYKVYKSGHEYILRRRGQNHVLEGL